MSAWDEGVTNHVTYAGMATFLESHRPHINEELHLGSLKSHAGEEGQQGIAGLGTYLLNR
jgi:hypothetical protein